MKTKKILAWHFLETNKKLRYGDGRTVEAGQTYTADCEPVLCEGGMHASIDALDALGYAPGPIICRVEVSGDVVTGNDKIVGRKRKVLWMADATETLRAFARWAAWEAVKKHWKGEIPQCVVKFLRDGDVTFKDECYRAAARAAADAADAADAAAAANAARAAAYAARAAYAAAHAAARAAARAAAYAAAAAARAAAYAARAAADAAARESVRKKQNRKLTRMLLAAQK